METKLIAGVKDVPALREAVETLKVRCRQLTVRRLAIAACICTWYYQLMTNPMEMPITYTRCCYYQLNDGGNAINEAALSDLKSELTTAISTAVGTVKGEVDAELINLSKQVTTAQNNIAGIDLPRKVCSVSAARQIAPYGPCRLRTVCRFHKAALQRRTWY